MPLGTAYAAPGSGGVGDGDKGDITVSGNGALWLIDRSVWGDPGKVAEAADLCLISVDGEGQTFAYTNNVQRSLALTTKRIDPSNSYDTSTGRYTPTIPGYYEVIGGVAGVTGSGQVYATLLKNGSPFAYSATVGANTANARSIVTGFIYMNGTTDYIELAATTNATGSSNASLGVINQLQAKLSAI